MQLVSVPGVFRVLSADVVLRLAARQQQGANSNCGDRCEAFHQLNPHFGGDQILLLAGVGATLQVPSELRLTLMT